jgi:hypothetical protein
MQLCCFMLHLCSKCFFERGKRQRLQKPAQRGIIFSTYCYLKPNHMPNQANRNAGSNHSSQGHPDDPNNSSSAPKPNPERSDIKHGTDEPKTHDGDTSRSSNQGRKEASGGSAND